MLLFLTCILLLFAKKVEFKSVQKRFLSAEKVKILAESMDSLCLDKYLPFFNICNCTGALGSFCHDLDWLTDNNVKRRSGSLLFTMNVTCDSVTSRLSRLSLRLPRAREGDCEH